jgi:hypothetical protein
MFEQRPIRSFTVLTIATAALVGFVSAAQASVSTNILNQAMAAPEAGAVTPSQILPAVSNPKPYRQGVLAKCDFSSPKLGTNLCIMKFDRVPTGHLLQVDKVGCIVDNGLAILFNSQIKVDGMHVVGFVLPPYTPINGGQTNGPYYFKAGETPKIVGHGTAPTDNGICSMYGTLWQTS